MITYHKLDTGEWVAFGPASEVRVGPVELTKRSGKTCLRIVDEVVPAGGSKAYGYLTEHCKTDSEAAMRARKGLS